MNALPRDFFSGQYQAAVDQLDGKRIALFTSAYSYIVDGVSLTLNRLVAFLEDHGADVLVFAPTIPDPPIEAAGTFDPVRSIAAPGRPEYRVAGILSVSQRKRLGDFRPDLIHIATPDILGLYGLRMARRMKVPVVTSYHTHFTSYLAYYRLGVFESVLWWYLRAYYNRVQHVYVPTPTMATLLGRHGIRDGVRLWPRGVETDRFNPRERDTAWRRSQGFADDDVVISFVSRLVAEKGLDVFAETLGELDRLGVRYRTLVVGDGPVRGDLESRLPDARFVGHLEGHDLARAYASSDVFVFPSLTETFGNVTLEAMASGLPTVCADAPGSDALVRAGRTGYLVDGTDQGEFARRIATLVDDPDLRHRMGLAAREEAERYAWPVVLGRIAAYYAEILGETGTVVTPERRHARPARKGLAVPA